MRRVLSPTGPAVLAHRAREGRGLEGRWPPVLARRAHRIDRSGQGWMVCSPDARSLRPPALLPATKRACGAATPIVLQVERVMTRAVAARPAATRALSKEPPSGKRDCAGDAESGQARGAGRTAWRPWDQDPDTRRLSGRTGGCGRW